MGERPIQELHPEVTLGAPGFETELIVWKSVSEEVGECLNRCVTESLPSCPLETNPLPLFMLLLSFNFFLKL